MYKIGTTYARVYIYHGEWCKTLGLYYIRALTEWYVQVWYHGEWCKTLGLYYIRALTEWYVQVWYHGEWCKDSGSVLY